MSIISEIIDAYAAGETDLGQAREALRQVKAKPTPHGGYDFGDIDDEGTLIELYGAAYANRLSVDEQYLLAQSLSGRPMGQDYNDLSAAPPPFSFAQLHPDPFPFPSLDDSAPDGSVQIVKSDSRRNLVFGWANVAMTPDGQVEDHQGHLIDLEDLENAAYNFVVKYRVTGDMHKGEGFGDLVESLVVTEDKIEKGGFPRNMLGHWWVGFRVPPEHWDAVESGDRMMFSIQGKARLEPADDEIAKHASHDQSDHGNWAEDQGVTREKLRGAKRILTQRRGDWREVTRREGSRAPEMFRRQYLQQLEVVQDLERDLFGEVKTAE